MTKMDKGLLTSSNAGDLGKNYCDIEIECGNLDRDRVTLEEIFVTEVRCW